MINHRELLANYIESNTNVHASTIIPIIDKKSSLVQDFITQKLEELGYNILSQDALGTKAKVLSEFKKLLKILISAIIMVISILIFKKILDLNIYVDLFIQILIGVIMYFLILNWLKLNEIKLVFQLNKFN